MYEELEFSVLVQLKLQRQGMIQFGLCAVPCECMQKQKEEATTLQKAGRIMCNVKLAAAWRAWLAVVDQRYYLQQKLGSALNLFTNRRLTLAWRAWKVCCS